MFTHPRPVLPVYYLVIPAENAIMMERRSNFFFFLFMAVPTKNQKIEALAKLVQKRSRGAGLTAPPPRTVLETLMYAALLENATFDKADTAYTVLENYYIDWNEIRVCSVRELADSLSDLPNPESAAERIRKALQGIFEKTYMFDLEHLRKKGKALAEHISFLEESSAGSPYMIQYAAQITLDGHLIPLDEASLRIMRRLGLSQLSQDGTQEVCIGLDRVILKKSSLTFAAQLHHFAAGFYDIPDSPELLTQLSTIDPEAVDRAWISPILSESAQTGKMDVLDGSQKNSPAPQVVVQKTSRKPAEEKPVKQSAKTIKSAAKSETKSALQKTVTPNPAEQKKPKSAKPAEKSTQPEKQPQKKSSDVPTPDTSASKSKPEKKKESQTKQLKKQKTASPSKELRKKKPK